MSFPTAVKSLLAKYPKEIANVKVWAYVDNGGNAHVSMTEEMPAAPLPKKRSARTVAQQLYDEFKKNGQLAGPRQGAGK